MPAFRCSSMTCHGHTERGAFLGVRDAGFARTWVLIFAGCWLGLICTKSWGAEVTAAHPSAEHIEFFENKIRPVLTQHCYSCHSAEATKLKGGLRLDSRASLLKGGDTGPAIVPGQPDASLLIKAVRYKDEDTAMPPKKPLPEALVADLEAWVRMGSPWPARNPGERMGSRTGHPGDALAGRALSSPTRRTRSRLETRSRAAPGRALPDIANPAGMAAESSNRHADRPAPPAQRSAPHHLQAASGWLLRPRRNDMPIVIIPSGAAVAAAAVIAANAAVIAANARRPEAPQPTSAASAASAPQPAIKPGLSTAHPPKRL